MNRLVLFALICCVYFNSFASDSTSSEWMFNDQEIASLMSDIPQDEYGNPVSSNDEEDEFIKIPKVELGIVPEERIEASTLKLGFKFQDIHIPGNGGLAINVYREWSRKQIQDKGIVPIDNIGWHIKVPTVTINTEGDSKVFNACFGSLSEIRIFVDGQKLETTGYSSGVTLPAGTIAALSDNSLLVCGEGSVPLIKRPDGTTWTFGYKHSSEPGVSGIHYLSEVKDKFGNWIRYNYLSLPYTRISLSRISRNDGAQVSFTRETSSSGQVLLSEASFNNHKIVYGKETNNFGALRLTSVTDAANEVSTISYTQYLNMIESVTLTSGLTLSYGYNANGVDSLNHLNLKYRHTSGPSLISRKESMLILEGMDGVSIRGVIIHANASDNQDITTEYTFNKATPDYNTGEIVLNGTLRSIRQYKGNWGVGNNNQFLSHQLLLSIENSWDYITNGTVGCIPKIGSALPTHYHCARALKTSSLTSILQDNNEFDTYNVSYAEFSDFGSPTRLRETSNTHSINRIKTTGYISNTANWIIERPTYIKIGASNSGLKTVSETTYHSMTNGDANYASLLLPYEKKTWGIWRKRYTQYHPYGEVKQTEYNHQYSVNGASYFKYKNTVNYYRGMPQQVEEPTRYALEQQISTFEVNSDGMVTSVTTPAGRVTKYIYDGKKRLIAEQPLGFGEKEWLGTLIRFTKDGDGLFTKTITRCLLNITYDSCQPGSKTYTGQTGLNGFGMPAKISQFDHQSSRYKYTNFAYDTALNEIFRSFPAYHSTESKGIKRQYDALGRVVEETVDTVGTSSMRYLSGNKVEVTDGNQHKTTTTYRAFTISTQGKPVYIHSPENVKTTIQRDVFNNIRAVTQQGLGNNNATIFFTETRRYNAQNQLCLISRVDVGSIGYQYNSEHKKTWQGWGIEDTTKCPTEAESYATYDYDNLGAHKLTTFSDTATSAISQTLDPDGNVVKQVMGSVTQEYDYDGRNNLTLESFHIGEKRLSLSYQYTPAANIARVIYPDEHIIDYSYNGFGEPTRVVDAQGEAYAKDATYHPNGVLASFKYGNGITHTTSLNDAGLPSAIKDTSVNGTFNHLAYDYDAVGNVTRIADLVDAQFTVNSLEYDGLDRLIASSGNAGIGSSVIRYDGLGNILSYQTKGSRLTYQYNDKNQLYSVTNSHGETIRNFANGYDNRGNVLSNGKRHFTYNQAAQLTASDDFSYLYDGFNRRVKTDDAKGVTFSVYSQSGTLYHRERNELPVDYIYLGKKLIAKNGLFSEASNTASSSNNHYAPYGKVIEGEKDDVGYTGHVYDTELDLSYMQARYYDPVIGRFYSNDPVGAVEAIKREQPVHGFNRYTYVNNNPYKYTDPNGEWLQFIGAAVGAGLDFAVQVHQKGFNNVDYSQVAVAGVASAVGTGLGVFAVRFGRAFVTGTGSGAVMEVSGAAIITTTITAEGGALIGGAATVINGVIDYAQGDRDTLPTMSEIADGGEKGFVSGGISGGVGSGASRTKVADELTEVVGQTIGKINEVEINKTK